MRVASFDVFDTLLTRTVAEPADIFTIVGHRIGREGLAVARRDAQRTARQLAPGKEVTFAEIYTELGARLQWSADERQHAMDCEIAVETQHLHAVVPMQAVVAQARHESDQIVFLSDMYLPAAVIEGWLRQHGFFQAGDRLYVSGEHRANKGSGALFEKAQAELGASFSAWTHHGDHPWSDQKKPRQLGISVRPVTLAVLQKREAAVTVGRRDLSLSFLAGTMRCTRLGVGGLTGNEAILHAVAAGVAGPLFHGFVRWCLDEAAQRGVRRLYFLARGSQIFWRIAQEIARAESRKIECRYLYASRLAFAGAAEADHPERWRELAAPTPRQARHHSVRQALAALGLVETEASATVPAELGRDWGRNLSAPERTLLADALLHPTQVSRIQSSLAARAAEARAYLAENGVVAGAPIALVDTGWMGSTQHSLAQLLGAPLTGFYFGLVEQSDVRAAKLGYTNRFGRLPLRRQTSHLVMIELLAQADHGPLVGFQREGPNQVAPRLGPAGPVDPRAIGLLQDGIIQFTRNYLATAAGSGANSAEWARATIKTYRDFHDHPSAAEAESLGRMPHSDQLQELAFTQLAPPLGLTGVVRAIVSNDQRPPCWWVEGQAALGHSMLLGTYAAAKRLKWKLQTLLAGLRDRALHFPGHDSLPSWMTCG